jgi:hypothetical protein
MDSIKVRCSECGEPCDLGENLEGAYALAEGWLYCPACNAAQGERLKVLEAVLHVIHRYAWWIYPPNLRERCDRLQAALAGGE